MKKVLGDRTSRIIQQQQQIIEEAQEKKRNALMAFVEGKGIDKPIAGVDTNDDGQPVVVFEDEDDE